MDKLDADRRFRIAFSFAGEKREFVEEVAVLLAGCFSRDAILYDKFHEAEFARWNLGMYLPKLYGENSDLIVPVLCNAYDEKRWTGWEWAHIFGLLTKANGHRVMPSRFDYAIADGLSPTSGYVELDNKTPHAFATLILERLALNEKLPKDDYAKRLPPPPPPPPPKTSIPHNLPALQPFFGREEELRKIADALDPDSRTWGALIDGPGGMGKTSLAVRAAYDASPNVFKKIVFVSLKTRELDDTGVRDLSGFLISGLAELLNEIARELGHEEIAKASEDQRPRLLLDALRGAQTLLLLDNLESLTKSERDTVFTLVDRLPLGCKAILTARGRIGSGGKELILDKLSVEAALAALAELATHNPHLVRTSEAERITLHRETGGNTLLLRWTAGQIGRGRCLTFTDALSFLRSCPQGNDPIEFVFGDLVKDFGPDETRVLCALTHFTRPVSVEHVAVTAGLGEPETDRALRELTNRSLVVPDEELKMFALVPMVPDFLRKSRPEIVAETAHRLEDSVLALIIKNGYQNYEGFPVLEAAWPRIAPALSLFLAGENKRLQTACDAMFQVFDFFGRWDEKISFFGKAESRAAAAGDYLTAGWNAYRVGYTHSLRGEADAVLSHADRATRHWEKATAGARERAVVHELRGLAHRHKKENSAAVASFQTALDLARGVDNRIVASSLNHLAGMELRSGDFSAAEKHFAEALEIDRARDDREGVALSTGGLAWLAVDRRDWPTAERLSRKALALAETIGRSESIAWGHARLARALVEQGKAVEALPHARDAEEAFSRLGSLDVVYARDVLRLCEAAFSGTATPGGTGSE